MTVNTNQIISMTDANQNFSKVVKIVDATGKTVIFKNNRPRYLIIDIEEKPVFELTDEEKIDIAAKRVLERYRTAFEELAK